MKHCLLLSTKLFTYFDKLLTISCLVSLFLISISLNSTAHAHEIRPAIVDFTFNKDGIYQLTIQQNVEALLAGIGSAHDDTEESENAKKYTEFRNLTPEALNAEFEKFTPEFLQNMQLMFDKNPQKLQILDLDIPEVGDIELARDSVINIAGIIPKDIKNMSWKWDAQYGGAVLRVASDTDPELFSAYLIDGDASEEVPVSVDCYNEGNSQNAEGCASQKQKGFDISKLSLILGSILLILAGVFWLRKKRN